MAIILQILAGLVVVVVVIIRNKKTEKARETAVNASQATMRQQEEQRRKNELDRYRKQQEGLVVRYMNSPVVQEMLNTLCNGDKQHLPEEFIIRDNGVQSRISGRILEYDFAVHRVPFLKAAHGYWRSDQWQSKYAEECIIRPQMALAEAINRLFDNEYDLIDHGKTDFREVEIYDESYLSFTYSSDHVVMRLKPTKNF